MGQHKINALIKVVITYSICIAQFIQIIITNFLTYYNALNKTMMFYYTDKKTEIKTSELFPGVL